MIILIGIAVMTILTFLSFQDSDQLFILVNATINGALIGYYLFIERLEINNRKIMLDVVKYTKELDKLTQFIKIEIDKAEKEYNKIRESNKKC